MIRRPRFQLNNRLKEIWLYSHPVSLIGIGGHSVAAGRYIAPEILQALVSALGSHHQFESFQVVQVVPGSDQWPISVQVTIMSSDWSAPRTFEVPFTVDDFSSKDTGAIPAAEVGAGLATHALILIEEWLATGPGPGIKEVML